MKESKELERVKKENIREERKQNILDELLSGGQIKVQGKKNPTMEDLKKSRDDKNYISLYLKGSVVVSIKVVEIKKTTHKSVVIIVKIEGEKFEKKKFEVSCYNEEDKRGYIKLNKTKYSN